MSRVDESSRVESMEVVVSVGIAGNDCCAPTHFLLVLSDVCFIMTTMIIIILYLPSQSSSSFVVE